MAIEIVDLPFVLMVIFHRFFYVYQAGYSGQRYGFLDRKKPRWPDGTSRAHWSHGARSFKSAVGQWVAWHHCGAWGWLEQNHWVPWVNWHRCGENPWFSHENNLQIVDVHGISTPNCWSLETESWPSLYGWLVVTGTMAFYDFPYIGNNNPNWLIFFRGVETVETTNQMVIYDEFSWESDCETNQH